jgi:hypothetical protein
MARKLTLQQEAFGVATQQCHAETTTAKEYGRCVSDRIGSILASGSVATFKAKAKARGRTAATGKGRGRGGGRGGGRGKSKSYAWPGR